ncbi:MAG: cupin domain-containing protein [Methanobrevibacter sp.]|nr:cupin domain-containing protein [Virgibacillus salexigens]MBR3120103.1 cupin domain-containing protein [Oceanobacillus sp.]MBR3198346.1 cupin domain-containing protein [Methanobrevibacter sp.]
MVAGTHERLRHYCFFERDTKVTENKLGTYYDFVIYNHKKGLKNMSQYEYPYSYPSICNCGRVPYSWGAANEFYANQHWPYADPRSYTGPMLQDHGKEPFVLNIDQAAKQNSTFRTAIWTGDNLQVTLMSIGVGEDIGLEVHPDVDQFLRVEAGQGVVQMGDRKESLYFQDRVFDDYAIMVPAGVWHNLINTGRTPLKLYTIYAPPEHPFGTVHRTKAEAMAAEEN